MHHQPTCNHNEIHLQNECLCCNVKIAIEDDYCECCNIQQLT